MSFRVCFSSKSIMLVLLMVFLLAHQFESKKGMVRKRRRTNVESRNPELIASIEHAIKEVILPEPCDHACATKILQDSKTKVKRHEITFFTIMEDASRNFSGKNFLKMVITVVAQTVYYVLDRLVPDISKLCYGKVDSFAKGKFRYCS